MADNNMSVTTQYMHDTQGTHAQHTQKHSKELSHTEYSINSPKIEV